MGTSTETKNSGRPHAGATPPQAGPGSRHRGRRDGRGCLRPFVLTVMLALAGVAVPASSAAADAPTIEEPVSGTATLVTTPSFAGKTDGATGLFGEPSPVTLNIYPGTATSGTAVQTLGATISEPNWSAVAETLAPGTYTAVAEQATGILSEPAYSNSVTFLIEEVPHVTAQPSDRTVNAGAAAHFEAAAEGVPAPAVQWEISTDAGSTWHADTTDGGATSDTLTISAAAASQNGNEYRAVFTNAAGTATSEPARLEVLTVPEVTMNPTEAIATAGSPASFTAEATGRPSPSIQWQVSKDGGATWGSDTDPSAHSTTLTIPAVTSSQNGNQYRALFTNSAGTATSLSATLDVQTAPSITANPSSRGVTEGESASFTAAANGNPAPTVQWQVSTDFGASWKPDATDPGATTTKLTVPATTTDQSGNEYRAVFSNSLGSATSSPATLTVHEQRIAPAVTSNPLNRSVLAGERAVFIAAATGKPEPTVQWEVSTNKGASWSHDTSDPGAREPELVIGSASLGQSGYEYRAVFANGVGTPATSAPATLTVSVHPEAPKLTKQPAGLEAPAGETVKFTAAASGIPTPEVHWQVLAPGGSWTDDTSDAGNTTPQLTVSGVTAAMNGTEYRAVFKNASGTVETTPARLTVLYPPAITQEPADAAAIEGEQVTFTAAATGVPTPSVQWEISKDGGVSFAAITGTTSPELVLPSVNVSENGWQVRAVFTNTIAGVVQTATTRAATLTVTQPAADATPPPVAPSASFTWFPTAPQVGESVTLASTSTDASSPITGFAWDPQGKNIFTSGPSVITTVFATPGDHTVQLRVYDANGQSSVATEHVLVTAVKLGLLQPFPIVRIAGTDSRSGAHISLLSVQAPVGARVLVSCTGRGCPRTREARTATAGKTKRSVVVLTFRRFERSLRAGVKLEVRVYAPGLIGKYTSFHIRRSKLPSRVDACLDPRTLKAMTCPT